MRAPPRSAGFLIAGIVSKAVRVGRQVIRGLPVSLAAGVRLCSSRILVAQKFERAAEINSDHAQFEQVGKFKRFGNRTSQSVQIGLTRRGQQGFSHVGETLDALSSDLCAACGSPSRMICRMRRGKSSGD